MARVTVEDCIEAVPNAFELVLLAAKRARQLGAGAIPTVNREDEKATVVALREIGSKQIDPETLREAVLQGLRRVFPEETLPDEEDFEAALEQEILLSATNESAASDQEGEEEDKREHGLDALDVDSFDDLVRSADEELSNEDEETSKE
jgi:DNA-directed RNA polymerase subunit omega